MTPTYNPTRIPLGTLTPKPREVKPEIALPSEEQLRKMVKQGGAMVDVVQQMIVMHKLPYRIENGELLDNLPGVELHLKKFITSNTVCIALKDDVRKLAKCDDEVLITGDTGTGKETIAKALQGDRTGRFIPVNCAGLPRELIESELFGHVKGAFTGAEGQKQGMLKAAKDGVLFLDEIGELPLDVQGKLLRALQDKKVRMVGAEKEDDINCKFVCATHRNLKHMVKEGTFREDLFARISTFELHIPPLIERRDDIKLILESLPGGKAYTLALTASGHSLGEIDVPYNVRSLQKYVKRYSVLGTLCYT